MLIELLVLILVIMIIIFSTMYLVEKSPKDGLRGYQDQSIMVDRALEEETAKKILENIMREMEKNGK